MSKKLLLADDSITIQKVIGITFANEDYELCVVDNGDAAFEKARSFAPDLILADVFMPGKNGYELCAAVKTDPALQHIPLLLLTGTFEPFDEGKAKTAGVDSWIAKPFESQALIDRVEELLARKPKAAAPPMAAVPAPSAPAPPVPAEVSFAVDGAEEEIEDDLWGEAPQEAAAVAEDWTADQEEEWSSANAGDDDIWGGIALEEESAIETAPEVEANAAEPDVAADPWSELDEEISVDAAAAAAPRMEKQAVYAGVKPSTAQSLVDAGGEIDSDWDEFGEDILPLDECDILEEEDLLGESFEAATADPAAMDDPFADGEEALFEEKESIAPSALEAAEPDWEDLDSAEAEFAEPSWENLADDEAIAEPVDAAPVWEIAEDDTEEVAASSAWGIEEEKVLPPPAPAPEGVMPRVVPVQAVAAAAPVVAPDAAVAAQVGTLSEEEIARIVEKVAGAVIERLAGSVLEKVVWEVVPDLAEAMIREEIRLIKEDIR